MTDAAARSSSKADSLLRHAVDRSFNCISVDGHMSTSDTVLLLAPMPARHRPLGPADHASRFRRCSTKWPPSWRRPSSAMPKGPAISSRSTFAALRTREDAMRIARAIADSPLVKTAIAGGDPNWGRIVSAAGYAGVAVSGGGS